MLKKFPMKSSFHENIFWRTLLSVGVQKPEDRKKNFWDLFLKREQLSKMKFFRKFCYETSMGYRGRIKVIKMFFFQKTSFSDKVFSWTVFWATLLSVRRQRTDDRKQKLEFGEKTFSLMFILLKKICLFCMIHQWGYIRTKVKKIIGKFFLVSVSIFFFDIVMSGSKEFRR